MSAEHAASKGSRAGRILINAMSGAGNRVATMAIGFFLTPLIINELGLAQYGLWSVIGSLAGYLGLLDFGLSGAFVKFVTEYVERGDKASARQVVIFGMLFYLCFGLVLAGPVFFFAPYIVHFFKMPPSQYQAAATLLRAIFALLIVSMIAGVPGMVVVSMHRMDLASRNDFAGYVAYAAVTVVFLKLHYGIAAVVIGQAAQIFVAGATQLVTAHRLFGSIWHNPFRIERPIVNRLFGFGSWMQLNVIFTIVNLDVGRFIAAGIVSVASVGLFEIAGKLAFFAKVFPGYLLDALLPAAASADARKDEGTLDRMYASATRYSAFLTFAFVGFLIGAADPIVRVWLGRSYPFVSSIIFWLSLGYAVNSLAGVGTTILRASGRPRYETYYTAFAMIANIASTIVLARAYGIVGVAMGTAVGWFAGTAYFLVVYHRVRHAAWWGPIGWPFARLVFSDLLASGAIFYIVHLPAVVQWCGNRLLGLVVLVAVAVVHLTILTGVSVIMGVWTLDRPEIAMRFARLRAAIS